MSSVLQITSRITCLPIVHGSGDCAFEVRRRILEGKYDCVAVPLPPSFQSAVETAIDSLPMPSAVVQGLSAKYGAEWSPERDSQGDDEDDEGRTCSYVPVDPCQPVIMALRVALGEHLPRAFIDLETAEFEPHTAVLPDAYALKRTTLERFASAVLPTIARPSDPQHVARIAHMARRLRDLERKYDSILFVCSVLDWPWIREAVTEQHAETAEHDEVDEPEIFQVDPKTLLFLFGELPYLTGLYERARAELDDDANLSIDGIKELLVVARDSYRGELGKRARKITPLVLTQVLKYVRNLSLLDRRLAPDLYSLVVAAKQTAGDQFALHVAETARSYPYSRPVDWRRITMGIGEARLPDGEVVDMVSRLPGPPVVWRTFELHRRPDRRDQEGWNTRWNPFQQCSWPPEDEVIENFRSHVFDRAKSIMGADLAKTEKFTTSIKDGIDIRDTLRHWYDGGIYVKVLPPSRGKLDCAVMLFDSPADPRDYPWRTTWFAEHAEESTLAFYASDFRREPIGPGICVANYGGALFLFPPISIPDIWRDPRLDFTETLEERLLAAACLHSRQSRIAILSALPPGPGWRRLGARFQKSFVHVPLGQFSDSTIQQLRIVHVLNGRQVRSYAADFIRKA